MARQKITLEKLAFKVCEELVSLRCVILGRWQDLNFAEDKKTASTWEKETGKEGLESVLYGKTEKKVTLTKEEETFMIMNALLKTIHTLGMSDVELYRIMDKVSRDILRSKKKK